MSGGNSAQQLPAGARERYDFTTGGAHSFVKTYIFPCEDRRMYVISETTFVEGKFDSRPGGRHKAGSLYERFMGCRLLQYCVLCRRDV